MYCEVKPAKSFEVIPVRSHKICCDGGGVATGHPRVFLRLDKTGSIACPYCSREYVYAPGDAIKQ